MQKQFKKPCPMGRTSYPTSDAELETWVEQTVQREIVRGRILQDQKTLLSERNNNSVFVKPPRLAGESFNRRSSIPKWIGKRGRSKSPLAKNARMSASASRDSREESCSSYSYKSPRLGRPACSMRISELAAPTKRQCIAAWRANAKVLPAPMVDRLKQRVLDQEPIVKVSDAVNCMRNKKLSPDTRNNVDIMSTKRTSRKINKEAMRNRIQSENKNLSDVFGMKIAQLLMQPVAITLNSQLQNLSNVISEEIKKLIKDTKMFKTDKATNMRMLQEISEKVTIWIARILEESSEKLLEEELKARAIPAGELITLIQIITYKDTDLEEQEGPVLDLLDDMVDAILHKCVRTPSETLSPEYVSVSSGDKDESIDTDRLTAEDEASQGDVIAVDEEANKDTIVNDIINQLNNVIESIDHDDSSKTLSKEPSFEQDKHDESDFGLEPDLTAESDIKDETETNYEPDNKFETDNHHEPDDKAEFDISTDTRIAESDYVEHDIKADSNINAELDTKVDSDIIPEPDIKAESNINAELDTNVDSDIIPEPDIKSESHMKPEPDIDVLYSNQASLVIPSEYNDDENSINEGTSDTPELNPMALTTAYEMTEIPITQSQGKGDENLEENIFMGPEENNVVDTNEGQTSNVSGAIELITEELSEEKNKKVQFSNENLDALNNKVQINPFIREILQFEDEHLESVAHFEKPQVDFGPPNEELLSDADESWPEKVPVTKPSASVTRSISSMGKLLESDEINCAVFGDNTEHTPQKTTDFDSNRAGGDEDLHNTLIPEIIEEFKGIKNNDHPEMSELKSTQDFPHVMEINDSILHGQLTGPETENEIYLLELAHDASVTSLREQESVILIGDEKLQDSLHIKESELVITHSKWQKNAVTISIENLTKSAKNAAEDGTTAGLIDQVNSIAKECTSQKFDYRVHPNTAPDWIRRGQGEPNGGPCACRAHHSGADRMKQREIEIRKWCRDLDFILMNLDRWKNWLNYISKYITDLKRKAGKISGSRQVRPPPGAGEDTSWRALNKRANGRLEMRRQDETVKFQIPSAPVKYCVNCGRTKPNQVKKRHHRSHSRNKTESLCKRHHKREI